MNRIFVLALLSIVIVVLLGRCAAEKMKGGKIPYLPISKDNVLYIGLYGSNNREATDTEKTQIIDWINNIQKYDSKIKLPKYASTRPEPSNIQIFTKESSDKNFMYILEKDDGNILISRPQSGIGYIVKHQELNDLLKQLRQ